MAPSLLPQRYARHRQSRWRWLAVLLLSVVVQVGVVGLLLLFGALDAAVEPKPLAPPQAVNLAQVSGQDWEHNREVNGQSPPVTTPPLEKEEPREKLPESGQVVATPPGNEKTPDDAAYLAESNNKVDKQSRSEKTDPNYRNPAARPTGPLASRVAPAAPGKKAGAKQGESEDRPIRGSKADQRALEIPTVQPRDEIALEDRKGDLGAGPKVANREGSEAIQGNSDRLRVHPRGEEDGAETGASSQQGEHGKLILSPSSEVLDRLAGAPPPDKLDVEKGDGLFLNTREFKYASFFNRVKQFVGMNWDPVTPMRLRDPSGEIYGNKDRYTLLSITLDASGQLEDAKVESSSGLEFLDLAAVQAFQKAQPFPNPPPGLLAEDHKVRFSFGFSLELGGAGRLRLFRQAN